MAKDPKTLTSTQEEHYKRIVQLQKRLGHFPTIKRLQREAGLKSPSAVQWAIENLVRKGYIEKVGPGRRVRGYRITPQHEDDQSESTALPIRCDQKTIGSLDHKGRPLCPGSTQVVQGFKIIGYWTPAELCWIREGLGILEVES